MGSNPAIGLVVAVVMVVFTFWFGNLMFRAVDVLYKPSVKKWMRNRPSSFSHNFQKPQDEFCHADNLENAQGDCAQSSESPIPQIPIDDEYLAQIEKELKVLKAMKGFTGPDPLKKLKKTTLKSPEITSNFNDFNHNHSKVSTISKLDGTQKCPKLSLMDFCHFFYTHCGQFDLNGDVHSEIVKNELRVQA